MKIEEAIVYCLASSGRGMRSEQIAKLEDLYNQATTAEKLKIIDLVSSTLGL